VGLLLLEPPAAAVVTLAEAQIQTRCQNPLEDARLLGLAGAATFQAEAFCRRRFVTQRWRATFDRFPARRLVLDYPPLASVEALRYVDPAGVLQTLDPAAYVVRTGETPGEIVPTWGTCWPAARAAEDAVHVEFTCGYGAPEAVPEPIRQAVLLIVASLYDNPASVVTGTIATALPQSAEWLLGPFRVLRFAA
jgi:uncharacterized phiE125 gp8 family phage protein